MVVPRIAPASLCWAPCLTAIALSSKAYWRYPASWLFAWRDTLTLSPAYIAATETHVYLLDGRIVGFYSLRSEQGSDWLDHLWVLPAAMGQGIGRMLFGHAVLTSVQSGASEILIESDPNAEGFYRHMGAKLHRIHYSHIEGIPRALPVLRKVHSRYA